MQSKDGGWAAFDVDNNWRPLSFVPFADHNAMLDPTCPDITGRVLEALCAYGVNAVASGGPRGVEYLMRTQEAGRKLVRTLGRRLHLRHVPGAARSAGGRRERSRSVHPARPRMGALHSEFRRRLGRKLRELQARTAYVAAPSTPSQTAWAILALLAGGDTTSTSLHDGIEYLIRTQNERWQLGRRTGHRHRIPAGLLPVYHLYRNSFPLLALDQFPQDEVRRQRSKLNEISPFA